MLDPLTATSLASAVVQFVDFSSKVLKKTVEIYNDESTLDKTRADLDAALVTRNLILVTKQLKQTDQIVPAQTADEAALLELRDSCERLGNELIDIFKSISKKVQTGRGKKVKEVWQSLRIAIRHVWNEKKIDEMKSGLESMRGQLNYHISAEIR